MSAAFFNWTREKDDEPLLSKVDEARKLRLQTERIERRRRKESQYTSRRRRKQHGRHR